MRLVYRPLLGTVLALLALAALYAVALGAIPLEGRFLAGALALLFAAAVAFGWSRHRRPSYAVLLLQLFVVTELGLIAYAIQPTPTPSGRVLIGWVLFVAACEIALVAVSAITRRYRAQTVLTIRSLDRSDRLALAARATQFLALTSGLLVFEPWFGVASFAVNAAWIGVCIPKQWRTVTYEFVDEFAAPSQRVFALLIDFASWPLYRKDIEVVSVEPPGPMAAGTEFVTHQPITPIGRNTKQLTLELRYRVASLEPSVRYVVDLTGRMNDRLVTTLESQPAGARITWRQHAVLPLTSALVGGMLDAPGLLRNRRAEQVRRNALLKQVLEESPEPV